MLVEACFNYTLNPPGYSSGVGPTFKNLLLQDSKTIDIDFKFADRKDLAALVDLTKANEGQGIGGTSTASQLGGDGGSGGINTDGNEDGLPDNGENYYDWWHFYAFGLDLRPNMTSSSYDLDNGRQNYSDEINSIQTCKFVEENKDKIFKYYSLNDEGVLTFDGKTSDELLNDAPEDPNLTLSEGDTQPSCEGSDAMGWLICPFIEGIYYVSDAIFTHFIIPFLIVEPVNTNEGPVYAIWGSFRTIGNILLVFGLLFIVFGQAIGGGLVDAYTAKKAMPRIFLAAILINLSIYLVAFLLDMGNILGSGIGELISSPLAATGQDELGVSGAVTVVVIIGLAASAGLVLMLMTVIRNSDKQDNKDMVKVALYTVAFLAIPAILVVLGIFFTLTIRLGLILLLTVMSPVALALFVMPATEKWAKKWLDWLIKSILVYPIMIAIFAIAGVLSSLISGDSEGLDIMSLVGVLLPILGGAIIGGKVAGSKDGGIGTRGGTALGIVFGGGVALTGLLATTDMTISDLMFGLVSIVVLFIPMALIPFSFKIAGGVMGSLVGAVAKGRGTAEKLFMGDKHNQHSRYYGIMGQAKAKQKDYFAKYKTAADRNSRGKEQSISGEGGPIAAATPKSASERMRRIAQRRRARFGVQQPIEPVIAADGTPTDEVASGGQGDENPFNRRGNNTPPTAPTAPTPPTPPNSPPPPNKPWTANNAPSSPYPRQNTPTSPVQPTQASVAQAQFGRQQAGGQNTSNDGYTTPSGLIVPDTDTVIKINDQRNKPN